MLLSQTAKFLGILLLSLFFTASLLVPFINFLYFLKFKNPKTESKDFLGRKSLFNELHGWKVGTPTGGGILIIISTFLFSLIFYGITNFEFNWTSNIIFIALFSFGLLGLYDDLRKFFKFGNQGFFGLRARYKFLIQWLLGFTIGYFLYSKMGLGSVYIPILRQSLEMGIYYIPFAAFIIVAASNAFNITDGMDGLAGGLLLITLIAFWYLASLSPFSGDIIIFIVVLLGSILAFLYFNIFPARIYMGDTGALAFGAMLGVVALMMNQAIAFIFIGGLFFTEAASSLIQLASMKYRNGKKVFKIAPLHHHLEALGWPETKVTMRFWLFGIALAIFGTFFALI